MTGRPSPALQLLGERIRAIRGQRGLSQEAMAEKCGLHRTYFSAVERGERNVSLLNLLRICAGLEVDPSELVGGLREQSKDG